MTGNVRTVVGDFHRTDDRGSSVNFGDGIFDPEGLGKYLRSEQRVFGRPDAEPVVILVDDLKQQRDGNHLGTVAVAGDCEARLKTIERAIEVLEAVRAGLTETGHCDWE